MHRFYKTAWFALGAAVLVGSAWAQNTGTAAGNATTLAGIAYPNAIEMQSRPLLLNGAGIRYKTIVKVYAAGLYLESKAPTAAAVAALQGPKRMAITMLREIDSRELGRLFARGMEDNIDKASFSKLIPSVVRMSQIFSEHKNLQAGDPFMIDWIPGIGTVITVKGQAQGEPFKEPAFFQALLGIWLGEHPADWKLKDALLGQAS
jgi:hypothetical protein